MESNNSNANRPDLTKFMAGLTTVFAGLQEMFAAITEQMGLASESAELLEDAAYKVAEEPDTPAAVDIVPKYTEPVQKKTTRKRTSTKKAAKPEPVQEESEDTNTQAETDTQPETEDSEEEALPFKEEADEKPPGAAADTPATTITKDLITKTVVAKIKQKRGNSDAIGKLVKSYGVAQLSDLPEAKYEAFLNDLSQL